MLSNKAFKRSASSGFTLIELLVVLAIVGILAAVAYPSYRAHVEHGQRDKARASLLEAAQFMQRYYAANNSYQQDLSGQPLKAQDVTMGNRDDLLYTLSLDSSATSYTLTLTPKSGSIMERDECGSLTLDQTGFKGIKNNAASVTTKDCWR